MATSTTYNGKPKPLGKSGHYYESRRHALQAKGIKTGTHIDETPAPKPIIDLGILPDSTYQELDKVYNKPDTQAAPEITYEPTTAGAAPEITYAPIEVGAEEIEIEGDEVEVKKPSTNLIKEIVAGFQAEKGVKSRAFRRKALEDAGKEADEESEDEEPEFEGAPMKFGKILADLTGDYRSEDLVGLNDREIEELAVKFDSSATGLFGKPDNPFLEELKKRITSRETIKLEKAKMDAELEEPRQRIRQEIADIRKRSLADGSSSGSSVFGFLKEEVKEWR